MKNNKRTVYLFTTLSLLLFVMTTSCSNQGKENNTATEEDVATEKGNISKEAFGETADGTNVDQYTLTNANGLEMKVITLGGIITSLKTPDKNGVLEDIVLGFDSVAPYETESPYFGAIIGRYGNRIAKGKFTLNDTEYNLATNNGQNHLHGGNKGFDKVIWEAEELETENGNGLKLSYLSENMEEGYPGNLQVEVTYLLTNEDALEIEYTAETDKETIVNLTQHTYFNLSGDPNNDILDNILMVDASKFLPIDSTLIPTGELREVQGTPFNFKKPKPVGQDINTKNTQLQNGSGYDHCWILDKEDQVLQQAATLYHKESGRFMEVITTEPAIQVYSGNFLDGTLTGKNGVNYKKRSAICLETEHYPDSPNQPDFPSVVLKPNDTYQTKTIYKFSTK